MIAFESTSNVAAFSQVEGATKCRHYGAAAELRNTGKAAVVVERVVEKVSFYGLDQCLGRHTVVLRGS